MLKQIKHESIGTRKKSVQPVIDTGRRVIKVLKKKASLKADGSLKRTTSLSRHSKNSNNGIRLPKVEQDANFSTTDHQSAI